MRFFLPLLVSLGLVGFTKAANILEVASSNSDLTALVSVVTQTNLSDYYSNTNPLTVFGPNNNAIFAVQSALIRLTQPKYFVHAQDLVIYHTVDGQTLLAADLIDGLALTMANGYPTKINNSGGTITISGPYFENSPVVQTDLTASNGVIQVLSAILTPPSVALNVPGIISTVAELASFSQLLIQTGLNATLGSGEWTVLAPTNDALAGLLSFASDPANADAVKEILNYHIWSGINSTAFLASGDQITAQGSAVTVIVASSGITFNTANVVNLFPDAKIIPPNILGNNGVAFALDAVLLPPGVTLPTSAPVAAPVAPVVAPVAPPTPVAPSPTVTSPSLAPSNVTLVQIVESQPDLSVLLQVLIGANLESYLEGPGPFTVFAPVDEAILAVQSALLKLTTAPFILQLKDLLYTHVIENYVFLQSDFYDGFTNISVNDVNLTFTVYGSDLVNVSGLYFNDSNITEFDLLASNGVLHKVNKVFIPPSVALNVVEYMQTQPNLTTFLSLLNAAGLVDTLTTSDFTVLAPDNAAFDNAPPEYISYFSDPNNADVLLSVLNYHIIPQVLPEPDGNVTTLEGSTIQVTVTPNANNTVNMTMFNQANVLVTGLGNNGIVYWIDSVLIPPGVSLPPTAAPGPTGPPVPSSPVTTPPSPAPAAVPTTPTTTPVAPITPPVAPAAPVPSPTAAPLAAPTPTAPVTVPTLEPTAVSPGVVPTVQPAYGGPSAKPVTVKPTLTLMPTAGGSDCPSGKGGGMMMAPGKKMMGGKGGKGGKGESGYDDDTAPTDDYSSTSSPTSAFQPTSYPGKGGGMMMAPDKKDKKGMKCGKKGMMGKKMMGGKGGKGGKGESGYDDDTAPTDDYSSTSSTNSTFPPTS